MVAPTINGTARSDTHIQVNDTSHGHSSNNTANGHSINGYSQTNGHSYTNGHTANGRSQSNGHSTTQADDEKFGTFSPIAICGMALRLPGGSASPQEFYDFLINKGDARSKVPASRYNIAAYYGPDKKAGDIASEHAYFLDESVKLSAFDSSRFSSSRTEVEYMDPQQRRLLEVVQEAFDDAGETSFRGKAIGCYVGNMGEDWAEMMTRDQMSHGANRIDGYNDWMLGNRISYEFGLQGPSMTIRTACSSALIGLSEACTAMHQGISQGAIVCGSTLIMAPATTQMMSEKGILGPDGSCKTFSADANGYARGEAITAIYVKPLQAALRDGNPVRAVIRAAVANSDGRTQGITQPNPIAHETMIRMAYKLAGISDISKTAVFECHGTGTAIGDPIETGAVANIFGDNGIYITSVKPNVGHTEGASGIVSLIKAVMTLEHQTIPPNIKFNSPNPSIPFVERKLTVPVEPTPLPSDKAERVSVNSFGLGGSNAHVIIDSAASFNINNVSERQPETSQLLLLSAGSAPSLRAMIKQYDNWLELSVDAASKYEHLAYTLANRREHLPYRAFKIVGGSNYIATSPGKKIPGQAKNLVFVFTGQGAQWPRMGRDLLLTETLGFRKTMETLDKYLQSLPDNPPSWTIINELQKPVKTSQVQKAELSQPLCTAVQIGLVDLLSAVGVEPAAVLGHSSGELAAAYAAGALTAKEAIIGAYQRGQAAKLARKGVMAAVALSWAEVEEFISPPRSVIACENSPKSVTISGDVDEVKDCLARIQAMFPDVTARLLKVEKAYHSVHMQEIGNDYYALIQSSVKGRPAIKPFFSSVYGTGEAEKSELDAKYWQKNLESPVLFRSAFAGALKNVSNPVFLEVGPHGALAGPARQIFAEETASSPPAYLAAMSRNENCVESYLKALGQLFELNIPLKYAAIAPSGATLPDLPRYPWNHEGEQLWYESRMSKEWRFPQFHKHPLLGRIQLEGSALEPTYRNILNIADVPWLRDHSIQGSIVFPAAGYVAMAGEAIRQLTGIESSYRLRHVVIKQALLLQEAVDAEVVTNLRRERLTDHTDSAWWEFTVSSYNTSSRAWQKHCSGKVTAEELAPATITKGKALPRKLSHRKMFDTMARAGMQYGPRFQRIENVSAGTITPEALGDIVVSGEDEEHIYHLHPTIIDAALQLGIVASRFGKLDPVNCGAMPTRLEKVAVYKVPTKADQQVKASVDVAAPGHKANAQLQVIAGDRIALDIAEAQFAPLEWEQTRSKHHLPITGRLTWQPLLDFVKPAELLQPHDLFQGYESLVDELGLLCIVYYQHRIEAATNISEEPSIYRFVSWVGKQYEQLGSAHPLRALSDEVIIGRAHEIVGLTAGTAVGAITLGLAEAGGAIDELLTGEETIGAVLSKDDLYHQILTAGNVSDRSRYLSAISHAKPSLRVLELGGSTGGTTTSVLRNLTNGSGIPLYAKYTYTDRSSQEVSTAQATLRSWPNVEARVLDIGRDPAEQGIEEQYDLIVASNCIHATKNIQQSLVNVRKLLAPQGQFLLQELSPRSKWVNALFGFLDDWWVGVEDGRIDEPYVDVSRWQEELEKTDFTVVSTTVGSSETTHFNAVIVATPRAAEPATISKTVTLLSDAGVSAAEAFSATLAERGFQVDMCQLGDELPADQNIISLLDESGPFFQDCSKERFQAFQKVLSNLRESYLLWVTRPSQMYCHDPAYAQIIGMSRSVRSEEWLNFATVEVDSLAESFTEVINVFTKFQEVEVADDRFTRDFKYAISGGKINVPRMYPFTFESETCSKQDTVTRLTLSVEVPGPLSGPKIGWKAHKHQALQKDEVEVQVYAAGVSSKDVSYILGGATDVSIGLECSGIVSRIGPDVKTVSVGDRVMALCRASIASHVVTSENLVERVPEGMSFNDAARLPTAFITAKIALYKVGNLRRGQSVLIHRAGGGVGLAALQLAQLAKANVYATVGSEDKVELLVNTFGVPRGHVFSSRDAKFVEGIQRETEGQGVDLVLNSLTGELLHATLSCVALLGKVVEISDIDLAGAGTLDLRFFLSGRTYSSVSLNTLLDKKHPSVKRTLQSVAQDFGLGIIKPLAYSPVIDIEDIAATALNLNKGHLIGRAVVSVRKVDGTFKSGRKISRVLPPVTTDKSASYLLAGGFGGIGSVIARQLVESGARRLVALSRNPGSKPEDAALIHELESMGAEIVLVKGDLSKREDVESAIKQSTNLKGILHGPMYLQDSSFARMNLDQWNAVTGPKVTGAWNLHEATKDITLDFFVLLSSMSGTNGQPGQANYAGANTFLDAFAQYRNSLGLAATSIDIGAVVDMGYAARDDALLQRLLINGYSGVVEREMKDAFAAAVSYPIQGFSSRGESFTHQNTLATGYASIISLGNPENRAWWSKDIRMAAWHNITEGTTKEKSNAGGLKAYLTEAKSNLASLQTPEAVQYIALEVGKQLMNLLLRSEDSLDVSLPLAALGLDSLVGIELRSWWRATFSSDISVLQLLSLGSLEGLAKQAITQFTTMFGTEVSA